MWRRTRAHVAAKMTCSACHTSVICVHLQDRSGAHGCIMICPVCDGDNVLRVLAERRK